METQLGVEVRKWGLEEETGEVGCSNLNLSQIGEIPSRSLRSRQAEKILKLVTLEEGN